MNETAIDQAPNISAFGVVVDLTNMIVEDQQSQHGDPNVSVERTPESITPVAQNPSPKLITTPEAQNPKPKTVNFVAQNHEPTPKPL